MNLFLKIATLGILGLTNAFSQIGETRGRRDVDRGNPRIHREWTVFLHPRFGYELPIPPSVRSMGIPEDAEEAIFQSADGNFRMSAWGGFIREHPGSALAGQWDIAKRKGNRQITYQRRGGSWFVVSGTDDRGIEFYEKFIIRGQQVAHLNITFPRSMMRQFESWVEEIEDGFRPVTLRDGPAEMASMQNRQQKRLNAERNFPEEGKQTQREELPNPKRSSDQSLERKNTEKGTSKSDMPSAKKVPGKPGFVYSPFSADQRIVDVTTVPAGTKVKCPYTMKIFRVP